MEKVIPLEDFDWEAFENPVSSQSTEESSEESVYVTEHTIVPGTVISINRKHDPLCSSHYWG